MIKQWCVGLAAVLLAVSSATCGGHASGGRKNVILITLDTTRADYLGCYGNPDKTTPNLDALAKEGTRFDLAMSTAAVTPVSHAAILTGLDNNEHGLRVLFADSGFRLPKDVPTLATVLKESGYHTIAVHSAFPVSSTFGFKRGFDVFESLDGKIVMGAKGPDQASWDVVNLQRRSDETTKLVEKHLGETQQPFFLWIHYWDPHDFVQGPPEEFLPPHDEIYDDNGDLRRPGKTLYASEIRYMDSQIGGLFAWLRDKHLWDDTLIAVVADHGQGLMDHDWAAHRLLYQEQIHVPLIVRVPGEKQQPAVADLVRSIDIFPTVLDYLGIQPPKPVSGRSLRALIEGKVDEPRIAFADQINGYDKNAGMTKTRPLDDFLYMAADKDWKIVYRPAHPDKSELFNISVDPKELVNLYTQRPDEALRMRKLLAKHHSWVAHPFAAGSDGVDPTTGQKLGSIGYVEGEIVDAKWAWTCPEHMDLRWDKAQRCPKCNELPILIAR